MSQQPFGDIPLFREIQRLLSAGGGPVNNEIARQVALAIATQGSQDPDPKPEIERSISDSVHAAEGLVAGYSRRSFDEPVRARIVGRAAWVSETLVAWRWLFTHLAHKFTGQMGEPAPDDQAAGGLGVALEQIAPLLLGIQVGTLVGNLSTEVLGRYDFPIPREDDGRLIFVGPNLEKIVADYGFEPDDLFRWLAAHDVARQVLFVSVPWLKSYLRSQVAEVVDAIEIDMGDFERRLADMQTQGMDALQSGLGEGGLPIAPTHRHRRALESLRTVLAAIEGWARHTAGAVVPQLVSHPGRIEEGMTRRRLSPSQGEEMLSAILGVGLDRALEASGTTFCNAIVELRGMSALTVAWSAPDNLPTSEEIKDPFQWMDRVLDG